MSAYNKFLENVYSDELIQVNPDEMDKVNRIIIEEAENFYIDSDGTVHQKQEPKSLGRIGGIEL